MPCYAVLCDAMRCYGMRCMGSRRSREEDRERYGSGDELFLGMTGFAWCSVCLAVRLAV